MAQKPVGLFDGVWLKKGVSLTKELCYSHRGVNVKGFCLFLCLITLRTFTRLSVDVNYYYILTEAVLLRKACRTFGAPIKFFRPPSFRKLSLLDDAFSCRSLPWCANFFWCVPNKAVSANNFTESFLPKLLLDGHLEASLSVPGVTVTRGLVFPHPPLDGVILRASFRRDPQPFRDLSSEDPREISMV